MTTQRQRRESERKQENQVAQSHIRQSERSYAVRAGRPAQMEFRYNTTGNPPRPYFELWPVRWPPITP